MSRHTPGPWAVEYDEFENTRDVVAERAAGGDLLIAHLDGSGASHGSLLTLDADARLIAAAPDLAAFVELVMSRWDAEDEDAFSIFLSSDEAAAGRAALRKAGIA